MQDRSSAGQAPASRRRFFTGAAAIGAAAAAVSTLPRVTIAPAAQEAEAPVPAPENGGGYRLSEHVKRYYKTTSA